MKSTFKFIDELIDAEPVYAKIAPGFKSYFDRMKKHDAHYIAHEYLNLDWDLMYFADVAELCQSAKLEFAMTAIPIEIKASMFLPEKAQKFLKTVGNSIVREQLQDYFINRQFRKDIFIRGLRRISQTEVYDKILSTRYVLNKPAADVPLKVNVHQGELTLTEDIYRPLLEYLEKDNFRPKDLREFFLSNKFEAGALLEAITVLVHAGHVMPCQSDSVVKQVKKSCERLNAYICEKSNFSATINFLASPLTGYGVDVGRFNQIFLAQYKAGNKTSDKLADAAWKIISRNGERMIVEDKQKLETKDGQLSNPRKFLETPEENLAHMKTLAEEFLSKRLPTFKALLLL